jgi:hypothetical protein
MSLIKVVALLLVVMLIQVESEHIKFGEQAINAIFKEKKNAFILFTSPSDSEASTQFLETAESDAEHVYTTVDKEQNSDHFSRFAEFLGIPVEPTPTLIYFVEGRKKYVGDASDLSAEALSAFAGQVASGEARPFLKSAQPPT